MKTDQINPSTGLVEKTFKFLDDGEVEKKLAAAEQAFIVNSSLAIHERKTRLRAVATSLNNHTKEFARLMAREMGKPLAQGEAEIKKCAETFDYFSKQAEVFLADIQIKFERMDARVIHEPVGLILAVMPWNFPFWQLARVAAPALAAGNSILFKPASNVPECAFNFVDVVNAAFGFAVVDALLVESDRIGKIISDRRIRMCTLTGSEQAGASVASNAGRHLKKTVLELGGSDPFIVCADAAIKHSATAAVEARMLNNGQSCICAKRFFVHEDIIEQFLHYFVPAMKHQDMGDPQNEQTKLGPLATKTQRDLLSEQVNDARVKGAQILCGGYIPERAGFYYPATVLTQVMPHMRVYHEEVFGPVAMVMPFANDNEAIALANDSDFGLGASVWTKDKIRRELYIKHLEVGTVGINQIVRSHFALPFGGKKNSGFGRELGREGLMEYVSTKTIMIAAN